MPFFKVCAFSVYHFIFYLHNIQFAFFVCVRVRIKFSLVKSSTGGFQFHVRCLVSALHCILALMFTLLKVNHV